MSAEEKSAAALRSELEAAFTPPLLSLDGQTALVTGASAGIGLATTLQLLAEGVHVRAVARRGERLGALAAFAAERKLPGTLCAVPGDIASAAFRAHLVESGHTDVSIFVCNAGLARGLDPVSRARLEDWREMIDVNVVAAFELIQACVVSMRARGSGHVVGLGSVAGHWAYENGSVYCATKHALRAFFEALRQETCGEGIRCTLLSPGMVATAFSEVRFHGDATRAAAVYQGLEPLRASDMAACILWALKQPRHVNIDNIITMPQRQGAPTKVVRR